MNHRNTTAVISSTEHVGTEEAFNRAVDFVQAMTTDMDSRFVAEIGADGADPFATMSLVFQATIDFAARTSAAMIGAVRVSDGTLTAEDGADMGDPVEVERVAKELFSERFAEAMEVQDRQRSGKVH